MHRDAHQLCPRNPTCTACQMRAAVVGRIADDWRVAPGFVVDRSSNVTDAALLAARTSQEIADAF